MREDGDAQEEAGGDGEPAECPACALADALDDHVPPPESRSVM
jgi:hypothetical protein